MPVVVSRRVCFNDMAVPLVEEQSLPFVDPLNLASETEDMLSVSLVNFKATGNLQWLEKGLELKSRWWVFNHHRVPLLVEVLEKIREHKIKSGGQARLPRLRNHLLPLLIRGKLLWFQNDSRNVILAMREEQGLEDLGWFLAEMEKDIGEHAFQEAPEEAPDSSAPAVRKEIPGAMSEDLKPFVKAALGEIHSHPQCLNASFLQSRLSFRVQRKDKSSKEFKVKDLKRKRTEAAEQDNQDLVQRQFDVVQIAARSFLEAPDSSTGPSSSTNQQAPEAPSAEPADSADPPEQAEVAKSLEPAEVAEPAQASAEPAEPARRSRRVAIRRKGSQIFDA